MTKPGRSQKSTDVRLFVWRGLGRVASISPLLGARLLERVFLSPQRHPAPERERAWLETGVRMSFESGGRRLGAWRWGKSGPAVLLVHGWEGRGAQLGAFIDPLLSKGFQVRAFDGPGHGISDGKRSSLVEMATAVKDAARALGPFHGAVAHSAGAAATTLAVRDGAAIERLVYVAPPADLGEYLPRVAEALGLSEKSLALARRRIAKRFGFRWEEIAHLHVARATSAPLLVIHDSEDREIGVENGIRLASVWRGSRLEITAGLGHRRILRDESVVSRAVAFLAGCTEKHLQPARAERARPGGSGAPKARTAGVRPSSPSEERGERAERRARRAF
jgi:pimeloyl-ACP methyl ester carboxylesterase